MLSEWALRKWDPGIQSQRTVWGGMLSAERSQKGKKERKFKKKGKEKPSHPQSFSLTLQSSPRLVSPSCPMTLAWQGGERLEVSAAAASVCVFGPHS